MSGFGPRGVLFVAVVAATLMGCGSSQQGGPGAQGGSDSDAAEPTPTYDAGGSFSSGDSGTTYPSDGGGIWSTDGGLAPWGDAAPPPSDDGGFQFPGDGGFQFPGDGGFSLPGDGGAALCNPLDPKYAGEFAKALSSGGLPTPCNACTAGECCYQLLGCVPL
jgi:hypothetical protein